MLECEDEDHEIRRVFKEELAKQGIEFAMKPVDYRTDLDLYWSTMPPKR